MPKKKLPSRSAVEAANSVLNDKTPFAVVESYKIARTNLMFTLASNNNKTVVITSCSPGEGKSSTCVNLAITMAQSGAKILIIDGDMRKPSIQNMLGINNKNGLSSVLCGFCNVAQALNTSVVDNLDVIVSGTVPPNPAELLGSENMTDLLRILREYYDYIFIDTPPINVVTDSQLMNLSVAGTLFVVREKYTTHNELQKALKSIKMANGKVLGFIKAGCGGKRKNRNYDGYYNYAGKK